MLLSNDDAQKGVCTHSSGNHAQALALAAKLRGIPAYVVMPSNSPDVKKAAVRGYGAQVIECEPTLQAREDTVRFRVCESNVQTCANIIALAPLSLTGQESDPGHRSYFYSSFQ
jgi:threonine dehydratase